MKKQKLFSIFFSLETTVELVYLDYGNNEERHINELRPLDPAFARLPAQAICAALEVKFYFLNKNNFLYLKTFSYYQLMEIIIVHHHGYSNKGYSSRRYCPQRE